MVKSSYYNTTHVEGHTLTEYDNQATTQEDAVLRMFRRNGGQAYPPSEVWRKYRGETGTNTPITSIRRAITNLEQAGKLVKTSTQSKGLYGRPEYLWCHPSLIDWLYKPFDPETDSDEGA